MPVNKLPKVTITPPAKPKLLDQVREKIRLKNYSIRTEEAYVAWIRRYIIFHAKRHPELMGVREIEAFLTYLAVDENVAASTQNQALSALLFLYKHVLHQELDAAVQALQAKKSTHLPIVLTREEVWQVIDQLTGVYINSWQCYCMVQACVY